LLSQLQYRFVSGHTSCVMFKN